MFVGDDDVWERQFVHTRIHILCITVVIIYRHGDASSGITRIAHVHVYIVLRVKPNPEPGDTVG